MYLNNKILKNNLYTPAINTKKRRHVLKRDLNSKQKKNKKQKIDRKMNIIKRKFGECEKN